MKGSKRNTRDELRPADATKARTAKRPGSKLNGLSRARTDLVELLSRMSERLMVVEKELARLSSENARLAAENSLLRARLDKRATSLT